MRHSRRDNFMLSGGHGSVLRIIVVAAMLAALIPCFYAIRAATAKAGAADDGRPGTSPAFGHGIPPAAQGEIALIEQEIQQTEAQTLQLLGTSMDSMHQIQTLGKLELFDASLSVNKQEACSFCHMPEVGYTGRSEVLNLTTVAYPGSVRTRFSDRKPMSYTYATLAPVLHYNATQKDFYGGNFWDMRATGWKLQSPAAEQAQGPPTNPVEMGLPDSACVAYRLATGKYVSLFQQIWGNAISLISWPSNAEKVCTTPAGAGGVGPQLSLSAEDRDRANTIYDEFALSIAAYEASPSVNAFSSKFDAYLANSATLTPQEQHGYELFNTTGKCNTCHLSGLANGVTGGTPTDVAPLFTDFTSSNLGLPKNYAIPYLYESTPDQYGYVANPQGLAYVDMGVGAFLDGLTVPDQSWAALAPQFLGKMQVPTLRNVDQRPFPHFAKAYMHNGYLKSLKEVVHFYNTRDHQCSSPNDPGARFTCWPAPEDADNEDTTVGALGLSDSDENDIVAFLKTLTDGYMPVGTMSGKLNAAIQAEAASLRRRSPHSGN
ncbi:MAG TPA: cytochrome c peroxidase [Acidobacteriaceae bacterium]|nr:cytochrome c peroxidase [Acidobacteriaceae bacterium]